MIDIFIELNRAIYVSSMKLDVLVIALFYIQILDLPDERRLSGYHHFLDAEQSMLTIYSLIFNNILIYENSIEK